MIQLMSYSTLTASALLAALLIGWRYYVEAAEGRRAPAKARRRGHQRDLLPRS